MDRGTLIMSKLSTNKPIHIDLKCNKNRTVRPTKKETAVRFSIIPVVAMAENVQHCPYLTPFLFFRNSSKMDELPFQA